MKIINNIIGLTVKVIVAIVLSLAVVVLGIVAAGMVAYDLISNIKIK